MHSYEKYILKIFTNSQFLPIFHYSYNDIHYLSEDFFSNMPRLERVALDENKLTTLHEKPFRHAFEMLKELTMSGKYQLAYNKILVYMLKNYVSTGNVSI